MSTQSIQHLKEETKHPFEISLKDIDGKLFLINLTVSILSFIGAPMYFIEGFALVSFMDYLAVGALFFLSAISACHGRWSVKYTAVSFILMLLVAWNHSMPTEGFFTVFYTDEQVELFRTISEIKNTSSKISTRFFEVGTMTSITADDLHKQ